MKRNPLIIALFTVAAVVSLPGPVWAGNDTTWDQAVNDPAAAKLPRPSKVQYEWHEQERLTFICLDPATWQGESGYDKHTTQLSDMKLEKLDMDQWMTGIQSWGAKEVMLVCKHVGGFCWWPTDTTDYSVKNIAWKNGQGNLVKEVADAARKRGLNVGVYLYSDDPKYSGGRMGRSGRTADPAKQQEWNAKLRQQWKEVLGIYGKDIAREIWFDGSCIVPLFDIIDEMAPNAVVMNSKRATIRWSGNEDGTVRGPNWNTVMSKVLEGGGATHAHSDPDGDAWAPIECDTTVYRRGWFWSPKAERQRKPAAEMLRTFVHSVGNGSVLLYNMSPRSDGSISDGDMKVYEEFGQLIEKNFGHPLVQVEQKTGKELLIPLAGMQPVNCVDTWEDYRYGQRIRAYQVEAWVHGTWRTVANGMSVGRRKIDIFKTVTTDKLRIQVTQQVGTPLIRKVMVHQVTPELEAAMSTLPSLARTATVTASTDYSNTYSAREAHDGIPHTRWSPAAGDKEPWLEFDFNQPTRVAGMTAAEHTDRIRKYVVEARNQPTAPWRTIHEGEKVGRSAKVELPPVTTRFVRFRITASALPPTLWEMDFFNRPDAWEEIPATLPADGAATDLDLSAQVIAARQYEIRIEGAEVSAIQPLFEKQPGEANLLEKIDANTYRLTRTHDVDKDSSTGLRLTAKPSGEGKFKLLIRPK